MELPVSKIEKSMREGDLRVEIRSLVPQTVVGVVIIPGPRGPVHYLLITARTGEHYQSSYLAKEKTQAHLALDSRSV